MGIKVRCEVPVYEVNGEETKTLSQPQLIVESHWNRSQMVVLTIGNEKVTVLGDDLVAAIQNAERSRS